MPCLLSPTTRPLTHSHPPSSQRHKYKYKHKYKHKLTEIWIPYGYYGHHPAQNCDHWVKSWSCFWGCFGHTQSYFSHASEIVNFTQKYPAYCIYIGSPRHLKLWPSIPSALRACFVYENLGWFDRRQCYLRQKDPNRRHIVSRFDQILSLVNCLRTLRRDKREGNRTP